MAIEFSTSQLRAICAELSRYESVKTIYGERTHHIVMRRCGDINFPCVVSAPQGANLFFGRFYKPVENRYSTVSVALYNLFSCYPSFFSTEGRSTVLKFESFFSKTPQNQARFETLTTALFNKAEAMPTAQLFRKIGAEKGDCKIKCADKTLKAHSDLLKQIPWFARMLAQPSKSEKSGKGLKIDLSHSQFSSDLIAIFLDKLYLGKTRDLTAEEELKLYIFQDFIGEGTNSYYFEQFKNILQRTPMDQLLRHLLDDYTPELERLLIETCIERLYWDKPRIPLATALIRKAQKMEGDRAWVTLKASLVFFISNVEEEHVKIVEELKSLGEYGPALGVLGGCYQTGKGVKKDREIAMTYYQRASEKGIASADYCLSDYFSDLKEYERAGHYNERAASKKFAPAIKRRIAWLAIKGDERAALQCCLRAQGHPI